MGLDPHLILHEESEWSGNGTNYKAFNNAGLECEVGEFIYSLVRLLKPTYVLETGTHEGVGACYIGLALKDNGFGHLDTLEYIPELYERAAHRIDKTGVTYFVVPCLLSSLEFCCQHNYQMILLDTEPQIRFQELVRFYPYLDEGGYIFIHDLPRSLCQGNVNADHPEMKSWPFGDLPEEIKEWVRTDKLRVFHLPSPRGLVGFYKPYATDYHWS